jgi:type IV pilus assembly protein PilF
VLYRRGEYERARFYIGRVNGVQELSNAQTLWLAVRIENKAGNIRGVRDVGRQLRNRFPNAPETQLLERGRFDD